MKIVHLCLSCFYIDNYSYQENELVAQHVADGHEVVVIASTETFGDDRQFAYLKPSEYLGSDGAKVIRLPYRKWLPFSVMKKLRMHPGVYQLLERESPDVILFHGLCGWELLTAAQYKKRHPNVRLYADSHEDFNNSARNFISKYFLHSLFYRSILQRCLPMIDKILCISVDVTSFVRDFYRVPAAKLEFFPLGGKVLEDNEYNNLRTMTRIDYELSDSDILFVQSGKIDSTKKLVESLKAFTAIADPRFRFIIAGYIQNDVALQVENLIFHDMRIKFVGWKSPDELRKLLCAADVYVQPGTQSATMQMSLCCRCAVILDDVPSHEPFINGNGWLLGKDYTIEQIFSLLPTLALELPMMAANSAKVAARLLDYKMLAARICN
jgi:1,2-diacylglycerol 3-alpha-glucosyltransferase